MSGSRLFWKLWAMCLGLMLVATTTTLALVERETQREARERLESTLSSELALLHDFARQSLLSNTPQALADGLGSLRSDLGARLTVIAADGTVLADSEQSPATMDNHLQRPEIQAALQGDVGNARRFSTSTRESMDYRARAVRAGERLLGFVRASLPTQDLDTGAKRLRSRVLIGGWLGALISLPIAWWFARRVESPARALGELASAVGDGVFGRQVAPASAGELEGLARGMNSMSIRLREQMDSLISDRNQVLAILGSMVEGVVAVDRDDRVVHMNEVAGRLLRAGPRESVGKRIWEVTRAVEVCEILEAARRTNGECDSEARLSAGGSELRIELRASPLVDGTGQVAGAVVVLHDVTELRRLESLRRDFVANVSHELKTPLTAIRGLVETLIEDPSMPAETRERFQGRIRDQALRLSALVGDLLTLARVEAQGASADRKPIDLRSAARDCAARFAGPCEAKGLELRVDLGPDALIVEADDESLRQIIDNLLDNALKYTPARGRIALCVKSLGRDAALEVSDTGIGIEPADLERIFERFYRVDKARSRELGGTGLGLAIVKHLALALGGNVAVESTVGRGSSFRVVLPRRDG